MNTVSTLPFSISRLPAFNDNYLWLIDDGRRAITVDPGDAKVVKNALIERDLKLDYILTTHHHGDHTGGVSELQAEFGAEVIGPDSTNIPQVTQTVNDGQMIELLGIAFTVITVPGHTLDHIAYFAPASNALGQPLLFCGDTLFAGGCGRVFEGSFAQMRHSLDKLKVLPKDTRIHCAHEYTQANLNFAKVVEPNNPVLTQRIKIVSEQRANNIATVPSLLADELATNPFLRYDKTAVIAAASQRLNKKNLVGDEVFAAIREWKDNF
ncbi:MAG: hydroxyacylglutathione hydrolase [Cellvibrionales bacterium]|nr:hydroxyacylglutathione hydrolase [Cellvibrionales bacterium]